MDNFKWSEKDNRIAELEMKMAEVLTKEWSDRPSVGFRMMFYSTKVQSAMSPIIKEMTDVLGRNPGIKADAWITDGVRQVTVSVK